MPEMPEPDELDDICPLDELDDICPQCQDHGRDCPVHGRHESWDELEEELKAALGGPNTVLRVSADPHGGHAQLRPPDTTLGALQRLAALVRVADMAIGYDADSGGLRLTWGQPDELDELDRRMMALGKLVRTEQADWRDHPGLVAFITDSTDD